MEIERKFLAEKHLLPAGWEEVHSARLSQFYISLDPTIRIRKQDEEYILTVKGSGSIAREEFELKITKAQYEELLPKAATKTVEKQRYFYKLDEKSTAEIDIYFGELLGLLTIEVEFSSMEDCMAFEAPSWFGKEVSEDKRYKNTNLSIYGCPKG